jgi:hypothetical protein
MSDVNEQILETLNRLDKRLGALESRLSGGEGQADLTQRMANVLDRIETLESKLPMVAEAAGAVAKQAWDIALENDIDVGVLAERGQRLGIKMAAAVEHPDLEAVVAGATGPGLVLARKALDADRIAVLEALLERMDLVKLGLRFGDQLTSALGDNAEHVVDKSAALAGRLAGLLDSPEFEALLGSGAFDAEGVGVVGEATRALVETRKAPAERVGVFGMLSKLGDADVQAAVGFGLGLAKRFGAVLGRR